MNAAVCARLMGVPEVAVAYRRTEAEMPAWRREIAWARGCGVNFHFLLEPVGLDERNGRVTQVRLRRMKLSGKGADGRRKVVPRGGPEIIVPASAVIFGTGREKDKKIDWLKGRKVDRAGRVAGEGVFLGGEMLNGAGLIVEAVADGKKAAAAIQKMLQGEKS